jgi:hypothetical protein
LERGESVIPVSPPLGILLVMLVVLVISNAILIGLGVALASWARVVVSKVVWGFGPCIVRRGTFELRLVPMNAYMQFLGANPYITDEPPPLPRKLWFEASPVRRLVAFIVAPRVAPLVVSAIIVGPTRAVVAVATGFVDMFGAFTRWQSLLDGAAAVFVHEGFVATVGLALAKVLAIGLVALPFDAAWAFQQERAGKTSQQEQSSAMRVAKLRAVVLLVQLVLLAAWVVAAIRWVV